MPAPTGPAARRPHTPAAARTRPASKPRTRTGGRYNPAVASDGLTVDTALGPVDLVAVHRKTRGFDVTLTEAETAWIMRRQVNGARREAARALGTGYAGLLRALACTRKQLARAGEGR
jgi:hypothetical protein